MLQRTFKLGFQLLRVLKPSCQYSQVRTTPLLMSLALYGIAMQVLLDISMNRNAAGCRREMAMVATRRAGGDRPPSRDRECDAETEDKNRCTAKVQHENARRRWTRDCCFDIPKYQTSVQVRAVARAPTWSCSNSSRFLDAMARSPRANNPPSCNPHTICFVVLA